MKVMPNGFCLLIKNNKKREAAPKKEAGRGEKYLFAFFFTWPQRK